MRNSYVEHSKRGKVRVSERSKRDTRRLKKRSQWGIGKDIKEYEEYIYNRFFDKNKFREIVKKDRTESLGDDFLRYLSELTQDISDTLQDIEQWFRDSFQKGGKRIYDKDGNKLSFDEIEDETAMKLLVQSQQTYYKNLTDAQSEKANRVIAKGMEEGKSEDEIADDLESSISSLTKTRARTISRSEIIKCHNQGQVQTMQDAGVRTYNFITANDDKVCPACSKFQGSFNRPKIYELKNAGSGGNPLPVTSTHPNCFDEETEVLTHQGFKYFKNLNRNDLICSLNPKTKEIEYVKYINYIEQQVNKLYVYEGKTLSLGVSENHRNIVYFNNNQLVEKEIKDFNDVEKIPVTGHWKGVIDDKNKPVSKSFVRFMGYWLSDGHLGRKGEIAISCKRYKDELVENLKDFYLIPRIGKEKVYFYDIELYNYLEKFGKCHQKYIPEEIKNSSPYILREFLKCYKDSHTRSNRLSFGKYISAPEKTYFTVSSQLADDLGEIILKVGHTPSYKIDKIKGKTLKFKNREYVANYDLYRIRENTSDKRLIKKSNVSVLNGKFNVYDVELEKNGILFVRRKGKCFFSGNCRCSIIAHSFEGDD